MKHLQEEKKSFFWFVVWNSNPVHSRSYAKNKIIFKKSQLDNKKEIRKPQEFSVFNLRQPSADLKDRQLFRCDSHACFIDLSYC